MQVSNWGNYPVVDASVLSFKYERELAAHLAAGKKLIARGLGRCYGDSSLSDVILSTLRYNRFLDFNPATGRLHCEAGTSLEEIIRTVLPHGWFLPVTPGTKYVTLGGAIASDVHGKNHHVDSSFCAHVQRLRIMLADGSITECSPTRNRELFELTCGGMGLTGVILDAAIQLTKIHSSFIVQETLKARSLDDIIDLFIRSGDYRYSVAWIDCMKSGRAMGRSLLYRGNPAPPDAVPGRQSLRQQRERQLRIPFYLPNFALNSISLKIFNHLYYGKAAGKPSESLVHYAPFFYPLDKLSNWNLIYGRRGFIQYQCVLPLEESRKGYKRLLEKISGSGLGSFLAVLKLFGEQQGLISFPMKGFTLALDFPVSKALFPLLNELDAIVLDHGGRLYLTKDARMQPEMFRKGYPGAQQFIEGIHKYDPERKFSSLQSERLGI